jgi:predicted nucleic acid-binding protein
LVIVVDSSVWIDKIRGLRNEATILLDRIDDTRQILVGDVILLEVLQGARSDAQARIIERSLRRFHIEPIMSPGLAVKAAANYRVLRSRGITIRGPLDMIIGTFCIEHDHALLHNDRDFTLIEKHLDLKVL